MLYVVHDESGAIEQANKLYSFDEKDYDSRLHDDGQKFIKVEKMSTLPDPDHYHVFRRRLRDRPVMPIKIDKTIIKAGGSDAAVITGIPRKAKIMVFAANELIFNLKDLDELEVPIPVPCIYFIRIQNYPYKDFTVSIEARA